MPTHTDTIDSPDSTWTDWDGSPLSKHAWYAELPERLRKYRTFWERGYVATSKHNITASPEHSFHLSVNNVKKHTFDKPNALLTFAKANNGVSDDTVAKEKESRYQDSPESLEETNTDLFDAIVKTISNRQKRRDYTRAAASSGIALLVLLAAEVAEADDDLAAWAATERARLVQTGIDNPTSIAFDRFREKYEEFTLQMGDRNEGDVVTAKVYIAAARRLGDLLQAKIDLRLDVDKPGGDLTKTVSIISKVLSKHETSTAKPSGHARNLGEAPPRGDPDKSVFHDANGKRIYVKGQDDKCTTCHGKHNGGHHLRINCPDRPKSEEAPRRDKSPGPPRRTGSSRAAASGNESDLCGTGDEQLYDEGDGVDVAPSDVALSELFAGGSKTVKWGAPSRCAPSRKRAGTAPGLTVQNMIRPNTR